MIGSTLMKIGSACLLVLGAVANRALGQSRSPEGPFSVTGTVAATGGDPVAAAEVALMARDTVLRRTHTDDNGRFMLDSLASPHVVLRVRRLGFQPKRINVDIARDAHKATVFVTLETVAGSLAAVHVEGASDDIDEKLRGFYQRQQSDHFGHFLDEKAIEEIHPVQTSDALRGVPGVVVRPARGPGNTVRIRGCMPLVWVDGLRSKGAEVDEVSRGSDVAAIEVYSSPAGVPAEYLDRTNSCATILIWLKDR
jgi:hypothetical protein